MIDHLPIERLRLVEEARFWRVVQWTAAPVALGVASAVAMTAQPFISQYMHMPIVGAWSVAVAIPLVSGLTAHMSMEADGLKRLVYSLAAVACMTLSAVTIIHSKEFAETSKAEAEAKAQTSVQADATQSALALQTKLLELQSAEQVTYQAKLDACPKRTVTACTKAATEAYNAAMNTLKAQYNEATARKPASTAPVEAKHIDLTLFDYVLASVPDFFAGVLAFAFFHARRKVADCIGKLAKISSPTQQAAKPERGSLAAAKQALGADIAAATWPPIVVSTDGQLIVNRMAKHYKLHSATVKKMLDASANVQAHKGKYYIKHSTRILKIVGGNNVR